METCKVRARFERICCDANHVTWANCCQIGLEKRLRAAAIKDAHSLIKVFRGESGVLVRACIACLLRFDESDDAVVIVGAS